MIEPDELYFLEAIAQGGDDPGPRLIYADWLEEHGHGDQAEVIRLHLAKPRKGSAEAIRLLQLVPRLPQRYAPDDLGLPLKGVLIGLTGGLPDYAQILPRAWKASQAALTRLPIREVEIHGTALELNQYLSRTEPPPPGVYVVLSVRPDEEVHLLSWLAWWIGNMKLTRDQHWLVTDRGVRAVLGLTPSLVTSDVSGMTDGPRFRGEGVVDIRLQSPWSNQGEDPPSYLRRHFFCPGCGSLDLRRLYSTTGESFHCRACQATGVLPAGVFLPGDALRGSGRVR